MADDRIIPVGPGETYTTLLAALVGEAADITLGTGTDERLIFECANFQDTAQPAFGSDHVQAADGWVTDFANGNYILIRAADSHGGIFGHTSAYRMVASNTFDGILDIGVGIDVVVEGVTIVQTAAGGGGNQVQGMQINMAASQHVELVRCLIDFGGTGTPASGDDGIRVQNNVAYTFRMRNCLVRGFNTGCVHAYTTAGLLVVDNNTFIDNIDTGLSLFSLDSGGVAHVRNNILVGGGTSGDYEGPGGGNNGTANTATNATEDASSPEGASFQGTRPTFVNEGAGDYHLAGADAVAQDRGTDLSADGTWAHNEDIDGEAQTGDWDIGADQIVAPAAVEVGLATESDTAGALTWTQKVLVGLATETDTAFAPTFRQNILVGLAEEADTAFSVASPFTGTVGMAQETDSAFDLSHAIARSVGLATSQESAFSVGAGFSGPVGLALETDTAFGATAVRVYALTWGTESNLAFPLEATKQLAVGLATETDSAFGLTAESTRIIGLASELDTAFGLDALKTLAIGLALETDIAFQVGSGAAVPIGQADEIDTAFGVVHRRTHMVDLAQEVATAFGVTAREVYIIGLALETDTAFALVGQAAVALSLRRPFTAVWIDPARTAEWL